MPKLVWDAIGARGFETGVDKGVLYTTNGVGVAWNGLTAVKESGPGGDAKPVYLDGVKVLNLVARSDFAGSIEAFTYPDEFGIHEGNAPFMNGLIATQQRRRPFGFSYRTRIGNDLDGTDRGYKLHIVYNALAVPSDRSYTTMGASTDPMAFSWDFTTTPKKPKGHAVAPLAHVIIDSTKTSTVVLRYIEEQLYGSDRQSASLITLDELFNLFENPQFVYSILPNPLTGLSQLIVETDTTGDLIGDPDVGLYSTLSESRLVPTATPGLFRLET